MALLNFAVTFSTPAALAASAEMSDRGAQWMNLATQAGYSLGPGVIAVLDTRFGTGGVAAVAAAGFILAAVLGVAAVRQPVPLRRIEQGPVTRS